MNNYFTYNTKYGLITLYENELYIGEAFKDGIYWGENTLLKLKEYINPDKNILEIGAHYGTSSILYSTFLNNDKKLYAYEPQKNMYNLLVHNINQNNLQHKIMVNNLGVFCHNGKGNIKNFDEYVNMITIDDMKIEDIGFIHCDSQGSENFIFSKAIDTFTKYKPVILYENKDLYGKTLYNNVVKSYPEYTEESLFDIKKYCMEKLNYSKFIDEFDGGIYTLLIP